ncbi:MAG: NAD(+) diphosphatase [Alphaproteobacteria bacterium]|nr:NAD(+) diphosphatase [Alphaproteobacteria bacterium]
MFENIIYAGSGVGRASHLRRDAGHLAHLAGESRALLVPMWKGNSLVLTGAEPRAVLLPAAGLREAMAAAAETVFLGLMDGAPVFASDLTPLSDDEAGPSLGPGTAFVNLREIGPVLPGREAAILAQAKGLLHWHRQARFCGVCGSPTFSEQGGHQRRCTQPSCGTVVFPRTDPAVIMLVIDENRHRALLGRAPRFPAGMYATLAGFVEPGETLEEAVAREVAEEAGIEVDRVIYAGSQPWPFPASLMLAFFARARSFKITRDAHELEDVRWFTRDEVLAFESKGMFLPRRDSIAYQLISRWLEQG